MKRIAFAFALLCVGAASVHAFDKNDPAALDKNWQLAEPYWNPNPGQNVLADVADDENVNNTAPGQPFSCGDVLRPAAITAGDNDYFFFTANAGDIITFGTDADGTPTVDTFIHLYDPAGTQLASDDDSGPGTFSLLTLCAPYTGTYVGRVRGFGTTSAGVYKAFVNCANSGGVGDNCATAGILPCGNVNLAGNTGCSANDYSLPSGGASCTGFASAGRDQVLQLNTAAGASIDLTYTSSADGSIYILDACSPLHCVGGVDATLTGVAEHLVYTFTSGGTYYLILDSFGTNTAGAWTLTGTFDCGTVGVERHAWTFMKNLYR